MKEKTSKITSKKSFHFWNSFNFLIVALIIDMVVLKFGDYAKLVKETEVSRLIYNWLAFACGFACLIYFVVLRKKCGRLTGDRIWVFGGILLILRGICVHFSISIFGTDAFPAGVYVVIHTICLMVLISFLCINTMISINCFIKQKKDVDYAIIHGAKVGSRVLNNRTDTAAAYTLKNPSITLISSGGKGNDEEISEAEYISERLKNQGIPKKRIILEDQSTTTYENLVCSKRYMEAGAPFMVVTDDYHILRSRLLAKKVFGYMPEGLPVHSSRVSLPHYILREYLSLIVNSLRGNIF